MSQTENYKESVLTGKMNKFKGANIKVKMDIVGPSMINTHLKWL